MAVVSLSEFKTSVMEKYGFSEPHFESDFEWVTLQPAKGAPRPVPNYVLYYETENCICLTGRLGSEIDYAIYVAERYPQTPATKKLIQEVKKSVYGDEAESQL